MPNGKYEASSNMASAKPCKRKAPIGIELHIDHHRNNVTPVTWLTSHIQVPTGRSQLDARHWRKPCFWILMANNWYLEQKSQMYRDCYGYTSTLTLENMKTNTCQWVRCFIQREKSINAKRGTSECNRVAGLIWRSIPSAFQCTTWVHQFIEIFKRVDDHQTSNSVGTVACVIITTYITSINSRAEAAQYKHSLWAISNRGVSIKCHK